jgi:hypothetical protein
MSTRMLNAILVVFLFICGIGLDKCRLCVAVAADEAVIAAQDSTPADSKPSPSPPVASMGEARVYEVHRRVSAFPDREDLSTPEAAYATIHRAWAAEGDDGPFWRRFSVPEIAMGAPTGAKQPLPKEKAERLLSAEVLEVHTWDKNRAALVARMPRKVHDLDIRELKCVKGKWLNKGDGYADSIEEARKTIATWQAYQRAKDVRDNRPPIADPAAHLKAFVDFLKHEAREPQQFALDALEKHRIVILGEIHNRPRYWAFNTAVVGSSEFARRAGVIYLELPSNDQPLVDRFLAASKYDPEPVIDMLRDKMQAGWPDQPTLDFFRTVWEVNQKLPESQRLRIVLADMAQPWKEIHNREDWKKYDVDRNQYMAENIIRDLQKHAADRQHALFIVGYGHAMVNFTQPGGDPIKSAGWHLREKLGEKNVFAIFPHGPVITDRGEVSERLALGLFDTAFAALGNKPMAFPLNRGPFGRQIFDATPESLTTDPYGKGYHAYLYLGPVEGEILAPLIPGFYTDEFVRELDRRSRVMWGKGLIEGGVIKRLDGASYTALRSQFWGQPRRGWSADSLGPLDAWHCGSHWEDILRQQQHAKAMQCTEEIAAAAQQLFKAIRNADYDRDWNEQWDVFPAEDVDYAVHHDYPGWVHWVCTKFKAHPVQEVRLGDVVRGRNDLPTVHFELRLKGGEVLHGDLPFQWNPRSGRWGGLEGLDWHLRNAS